MDKEWMSKNRLSREYELGVESFLQFAMKNANDHDAIPCPCAKCGNLKKKNVETIRAHMYSNGIDLTYHTWIWHGERSIIHGCFSKLSEQQKEKRNQNIYPHRLVRKGYARFAEEIAAELCDDDEINRAIMWKKGRLNKEENFEGQDLTKSVDKSDAYLQEKREGNLILTGTKDDILAKAVEPEEHAGRVWGVGGHITPTINFNVGRTPKGLTTEQKQSRELMEVKKKILEHDARIKKLEAIVYKSCAGDVSIDDKSSCSVKFTGMNEKNIKTDDEL